VYATVIELPLVGRVPLAEVINAFPVTVAVKDSLAVEVALFSVTRMFASAVRSVVEVGETLAVTTLESVDAVPSP